MVAGPANVILGRGRGYGYDLEVCSRLQAFVIREPYSQFVMKIRTLRESFHSSSCIDGKVNGALLGALHHFRYADLGLFFLLLFILPHVSLKDGSPSDVRKVSCVDTRYLRVSLKLKLLLRVFIFVIVKPCALPNLRNTALGPPKSPQAP